MHRAPLPRARGESEEDDVAIRLTGETRFVEGGEADVVVHQHGAAELVREQLSDARLDQMERLHRGLGGGESVPAGGVRARQADPDPGEGLEMDLAHGQVPDGLQRQPDTRFPARALDVIGHAGGDHLSGRVRQAERGGGVAEVDADVAHRARMGCRALQPDGRGHPASAALADGDDALIEQVTEDVRHGGAGEPQRLGDLTAGEQSAAMEAAPARLHGAGP